MAKKAPVKKTAAARVETAPLMEEHTEELSRYNPSSQPERGRGLQDFSDQPYSLQAMLNFMNRNAALIFMGVGIFVLGFVVGSLWQENKLLKDGVAKGGTAAVAPAAGAPTAAAPEAPAGPLSDDNWKKVQDNPAAVIGNKNAKITLVEFTDYQCPFCARHFSETYPKLKEKYIDTGKVKLVIKDQALPMHPNAKNGASAARCAGDQGKYEAMHDSLFQNQDSWASLGSDAAVAKMGELATAAGVDGNKVVECVKSGKYLKAVEADSALGLQPEIGATGTPTFFLEKQPIVGAQPLSVFEAAIEKAL